MLIRFSTNLSEKIVLLNVLFYRIRFNRKLIFMRSILQNRRTCFWKLIWETQGFDFLDR